MLYVKAFIPRMRLNKHLMRALPVQLVLHMFPDLSVSLFLFCWRFFWVKKFTFEMCNCIFFFFPNILKICCCCLLSYCFFSGVPNDVSVQNKGTWYVSFAQYTFFILVYPLEYMPLYKCLIQFKTFLLQSHSSTAWKVSGLRRLGCLYCVAFPCHPCISADSGVPDWGLSVSMELLMAWSWKRAMVMERRGNVCFYYLLTCIHKTSQRQSAENSHVTDITVSWLSVATVSPYLSANKCRSCLTRES